MSGITHTCAAPGCKRWGAFGEGVKLRKGKPGTWWCADHVPPRLLPPGHPKHRPQRAEAAAPKEPVPAVPGGLF